jgi:hypothetical protein
LPRFSSGRYTGLGGEGVAVGLDQLELRADARAVAGARDLGGAGADGGLDPGRATARDVGVDGAPRAEDRIADGEPGLLRARAVDQPQPAAPTVLAET